MHHPGSDKLRAGLPLAMKILLDFLPIILFFASFRYANANQDWAGRFATEHFGAIVSGGVVSASEGPVLLSTMVVIAATLAQVLLLKLLRRKVDLMLWFSLGLVTLLGGLTIWLHNETFIKWKPSGLYWAFGLTLWASQALFGKNLLKSMLGEQLELPGPVWQRLNFAWVAFFGLMGLLNIWIAYSFETAVWVDFKVFGGTGLMLAFMIAQGFYIQRHLPELPSELPPETAARPQDAKDGKA
jgi:intracellular septation protein